jgi:hypothetical protein
VGAPFFFLVKISLLVFSISSPVAAEEDDHSYIRPFFFFGWLHVGWLEGVIDVWVLCLEVFASSSSS